MNHVRLGEYSAAAGHVGGHITCEAKFYEVG